MGVVIPGAGCAARNSSASGAQVIDGSLKFWRESSSVGSYLTRTPSTTGNRKVFTLSVWLKRCSNLGEWQRIISASPAAAEISALAFRGDGNTDGLRLQLQYSGVNDHWTSSAKYRDTSGWYHVVMSVDLSLGSGASQKIYINGVRDTGSYTTGSEPSSSDEYFFNDASTEHRIATGDVYPTNFDGLMSQFYWIDGQALEPSDFGYSDPLTNTWRPKKYTGGLTVVEGTELLYNVNTADNGFDSSSTSRTYDAASRTFTTYSTPQSANPGGYGANSAHVYKSPTGGAITWVVSTDTTDRYIWTSSDGENWSSTGSYYDTDSSPQSVTAVYIALAAGSNGSFVTVTSSTAGIGQAGSNVNTFYLPFDGNSPIWKDQSGNNNDWTPVNFGGSNVIPKATGALPILNTVNGGKVATAGVRTDASGNNCVLALPLVGSANDVSNQINSGSTTKVVTVNNAVASSTYSNFYGGSYYFDGTGDYLSIPNTTAVNFGSGDFTVECWAYFTDVTAETLVGQWENGSARRSWLLQVNSGVLSSYLSADGGTSGMLRIDSAAGAIVTGRWYHLAFGRSSNTMRMFIDGVVVGTDDATGFTNYANTNDTFQVGSQTSAGSNLMTGYIQDVRIYKGVGKDTSDFIAASTNPDILADTPSGVALSSELTKVTDGAVAFDGSGDYLVVPNSSDVVFDQGTFTIECWIYAASYNSITYPTVISKYDNGDASWILRLKSDGDIVWYAGQVGGGTNNESTTQPIRLNSWQHVAVVREGTGSNETKVYFDGQLVLTCTDTSDYDDTNDIYIGRQDSSNANEFDGFISNVRILKGTALYTSNFTPPTAPLTDVTNTKLLCCQSNTSAIAAAVVPDAGTGTALLNIPLSSTPFTDSSSTGATITNTGSIAAVTDLYLANGANRFNITNVASLDGSSQRLSTDNTNLPFNNVPWTLDVWFSLGYDASGYNAIFNTGYGSQTSNYMYIGLDDDEKPYIETSDSGSKTTATNALVRNKWYHMRVRSDGTSMMQYIDGVLVVTKTCGSTDLSSKGTKTIGSLLDNANNANNFDGFMGPVRYVSSDLGPPPPGGSPTTAGAVSNTPDLPDITAAGDAVATNFNPFTNNINTVMGQETGYATLNSMWKYSGVTLSDGNLTASCSSEGDHSLANSTLRVPRNTTSGKWYFEGWSVVAGSGFILGFGSGIPVYGYYSGPCYNLGDGNIILTNEDGSGAGSQGNVGTTGIGIVIGVAADYDAKRVRFYKENVLLWDAPMETNGGDDASSWIGCPYVDIWGTATCAVNFGQKPFKYAPPEGHQPLNSANLPSPGVVRPAAYVGVSTWSGDSSERLIVTGNAPDLVWINSRSNDTQQIICDVVRGGTAVLSSSSTSGEEDPGTWGNVKTFNSNGFTLQTGASGYHRVNLTGRTYVGWCWKAGGNKNTFNVDGVGYANASDVSMDVGGLNSAVYLMDEVYSSVLYGYNETHGAQFQTGAEAVKAFNGTIGSAWDEGASPLGAGPTTFIRFTPSSQVATNTVQVYIQRRIDVNFYTGTPGSCEHVAGPFNTSTSAYFTKVDCGKVPAWDFMEMRSNYGTGGVYFGGIEIGGKLLIDSDVTPPTSVPTIAATGASVGTKEGFSITVQTAVSGSGDTMQIAHGLTQKPDFIIGKDIATGSTNWGVYHSYLGATNKVDLDTTGASAANANYWANTEPTSSVIYSNAASWMYTSSSFILYSWHNVPGLQKFGGYAGNGSATNGVFIELGFRPAVVIIKNVTGYTENWLIFDNQRNKFNVTTNYLYPNLSNEEDDQYYDLDFLSNGFKLYNNAAGTNTSGSSATYLYAAWGYQPINNLYGGQSNAR